MFTGNFFFNFVKDNTKKFKHMKIHTLLKYYLSIKDLNSHVLQQMAALKIINGNVQTTLKSGPK